MKQAPANVTQTRVGTVGILALFLLVSLWCAPSALADFEQVAPPPPVFEDPPGEALLRRTGAAVNVSGSGGVEAGTVYVSGRIGIVGVHSYDSHGNFQASWGGLEAYGVAVSQSTGCVYLFTPREAHAVTVFNADGSKEMTSFPEVAPFGESISASPAKFHEIPSESAVAVDGAGNVYLADRSEGGAKSRIMVFKPQSPGDCEHYSYAGQASDIAVELRPHQLQTDGAGDLYAVTGPTSSKIQEFETAKPSTPVCEFEQVAGGILGLAVDSGTGQVFYSFAADKKRAIHVLQACEEGELKEEDEPIVAKPKPDDFMGIFAVNPSLVWEVGRPAGVLYAVGASIHEPEPSYIFAPAVSHEPVVESESVGDVTATSATLKAQINPQGATTRYTFQYLTAAAFEANEPGEPFAGASEVPLGGAPLGAGQNALPAAVSVSGLTPETEYRYRVLATSSEGGDEGDAESFHTFAVQAEGPPDGRLYELVSPNRKASGEVFPLNPLISSCENDCKPGTVFDHLPVQAATNGDGLFYEGFPFSTDRAPSTDEYLSTRSASGWQTTNPTPPSYLGRPRTGYYAFSADLATALLGEEDGSTLSEEAPAGYPNLFLQESGDPAVFSPLLREAPPGRPPGGSLRLEYAAATEDLSHIAFAANDALTRPTPFAPEADGSDESKFNLYEWVGGQLRLVNVLPNGESVPGAAFGSGSRLSEEKTGTDENFFGEDFSHAVSADGSRIFWSSDESPQVYVRVNGKETVELLDHEGRFLTASADGSKVLLSDGCLYDLEGESCTDLNGSQEGLEGILGQSEDLTSIYFLDTAALTLEGEENANGEHAEDGANNLYSWQEGSLSFIARLADDDLRDWTIAPLKRSAEASPNGRWLAFLSQVPLTGVDNVGPCVFDTPSQKILPGPCPEAFVFDAGSGTLRCASCDPSGESPLGRTFLPRIGVSSTLSPLLQPRYLTDSGQLFFDTRDSLSPFDTNGNAEDVYEQEPQGVGTCTRLAGCTSLISAGREPIDSNFLAIDPTGKNVFFTTRDRLVPADRDDLLDVYDAREGGGILEEGIPGECEGESCQPMPNAPDEPLPGSLGFQGSGNVPGGGTKRHHQARRHRKRRHRHGHGHRVRHRHHARAAAANRGGAR